MDWIEKLAKATATGNPNVALGAKKGTVTEQYMKARVGKYNPHQHSLIPQTGQMPYVQKYGGSYYA